LSLNYYIIRKKLGSKTAISLLKALLANIEIAAVTSSEIRRALDLDWGDFEDAVQYSAGERLAVDYIITRNISDFTFASIPILTPDELVALLCTSP